MSPPNAVPSRSVSLLNDADVEVAATLHRDLDPACLFEIEVKWGPARRSVQEALTTLQKQGLEHSHWDWRNKIDRATNGQLLLSGIECGSEIQGVVAVASRPRRAAASSGLHTIYVDYVEIAPWNLRTPLFSPRYRGVGSLLLMDAILRSLEMGHEGRISLHSLPSSEGFYLQHCGMVDLGEDPAYYYLKCFEHTAETAQAWLSTF